MRVTGEVTDDEASFDIGESNATVVNYTIAELGKDLVLKLKHNNRGGNLSLLVYLLHYLWEIPPGYEYCNSCCKHQAG